MADEKKVSPARKAANKRYDAKTYTQLRALCRIDLHLTERIKQAVQAGKAPSISAYIVQAVQSALDRDGVALDDLPTATDSPIDDLAQQQRGTDKRT